MMIKISTLFVVLVVHAALAENGHTGYDYRAPASAMSFQLPSNLRPNLPQTHYNQAHELQNGFLPSPVYNQYYAGDYKNPQTQHALHYYNQGYSNVQSTYQNVNYNSFTPNHGNGNLAGAQSIQQSLQGTPSQNPTFSYPTPQQTVITKHIYFHLPPPDDTANAVPVTRTPPKKTYNIIFIKLPSQTSTSATRLQQQINQQAAAESKTLIYVLVKKPMAQPIEPVTSKHEVFFVKYKEPRKVVQPINSGIVQVAQGTGLLPGQINGHVEK